MLPIAAGHRARPQHVPNSTSLAGESLVHYSTLVSHSQLRSPEVLPLFTFAQPHPRPNLRSRNWFRPNCICTRQTVQIFDRCLYRPWWKRVPSLANRLFTRQSELMQSSHGLPCRKRSWYHNWRVECFCRRKAAYCDFCWWRRR